MSTSGAPYPREAGWVRACRARPETAESVELDFSGGGRPDDAWLRQDHGNEGNASDDPGSDNGDQPDKPPPPAQHPSTEPQVDEHQAPDDASDVSMSSDVLLVWDAVSNAKPDASSASSSSSNSSSSSAPLPLAGRLHRLPGRKCNLAKVLETQLMTTQVGPL